MAWHLDYSMILILWGQDEVCKEQDHLVPLRLLANRQFSERSIERLTALDPDGWPFHQNDSNLLVRPNFLGLRTALVDFDAVIELEPEKGRHHWRGQPSNWWLSDASGRHYYNRGVVYHRMGLSPGKPGISSVGMHPKLRTPMVTQGSNGFSGHCYKKLNIWVWVNIRYLNNWMVNNDPGFCTFVIPKDRLLHAVTHIHILTWCRMIPDLHCVIGKRWSLQLMIYMGPHRLGISWPNGRSFYVALGELYWPHSDITVDPDWKRGSVPEMAFRFANSLTR